METGNETAVTNLKEEIAKLSQINKTKSDEIAKLYHEISIQRDQNMKNTKNLENVIEELKEKMRMMEKEVNEET